MQAIKIQCSPSPWLMFPTPSTPEHPEDLLVYCVSQVQGGGSGTWRTPQGYGESLTSGKASALWWQIRTRLNYLLSISCTVPEILFPAAMLDAEWIIDAAVLHLRAWKLLVGMWRIGDWMSGIFLRPRRKGWR